MNGSTTTPTAQLARSDTTEIPTAKGSGIVTMTTRRRSSRIALVKQCPYCGRSHLHRWPFRFREPGLKSAACGRGRYRVEVDAARTADQSESAVPR